MTIPKAEQIDDSVMRNEKSPSDPKWYAQREHVTRTIQVPADIVSWFFKLLIESLAIVIEFA
jgi:hypothetical protein